MAYKFNPFTGKLDEVGAGGGGGTPGGSDTQIQFNDGGSFGGDADLTWNKTTNLLDINGDIQLDDGGASTTTIQCVTPTLDRTISFPDATGTVALVAGSSGQLVYNNAGAQAGATGSVVDSSGNVTIGGLTTLAGSPSANNTSGVLINGTWRTGASSNNPQLLINNGGTTLATTWGVNGTGLGINAPASYGGNLIDLKINGSSTVNMGGNLTAFDQTVIFGSLVSTSARAQAGNGFGVNNVNGYNFSSTGGATGTADITLIRDAAGFLAQRSGTTAQTFRVYNTYTDASNYERGFLKWNSNVFEIGSEGSGTGSEKPVRITAATLKLPNLPTYADNAAAIAGSLVAGDVYKTATGELRITV